MQAGSPSAQRAILHIQPTSPHPPDVCRTGAGPPCARLLEPGLQGASQRSCQSSGWQAHRLRGGQSSGWQAKDCAAVRRPAAGHVLCAAALPGGAAGIAPFYQANAPCIHRPQLALTSLKGTYSSPW